MPSADPKSARPARVVILGTGGTIAGRAATPDDHVGYRASEIGIAALVAAVPPLAALALDCEQVAQVDSKNMGFAVWQALAQRAAVHLARPEVAGVVVTHGTDTLEETAYFLHRVLAPAKPLVLTAAMRPATALLADGPQNLLDAVTLARHPGARGVLAVLAGEVHGATAVRKSHTYRLHAFDSGDAGPLARIEQGRVRQHCAWPGVSAAQEQLAAPGRAVVDADPARWPWVEVLTSHAGASGDAVRALVAAGIRGIVVAGVGNGHVHQALLAALREAEATGVAVRLASRCAAGPVIGGDGGPAPGSYGDLGAVKSRIELMLELLTGDTAKRA